MGPELKRFNLLNKKSNDWDYANFIFVNNDDYCRFGITEDALYQSIGQPIEKLDYNQGAFSLYIWDKNIIQL